MYPIRASQNSKVEKKFLGVVLFNGVDYKLICRKPPKVLKELPQFELKRIGVIQNKKRHFGTQTSLRV